MHARKYSIADARKNLPGIVHEVEAGAPVELTRRGEPVAVVVSIRDYERMKSGRPRFRDLYRAFREAVDVDDLDLGPGYFERLRDRSPGRDVKL